VEYYRLLRVGAPGGGVSSFGDHGGLDNQPWQKGSNDGLVDEAEIETERDGLIREVLSDRMNGGGEGGISEGNVWDDWMEDPRILLDKTTNTNEGSKASGLSDLMMWYDKTPALGHGKKRGTLATDSFLVGDDDHKNPLMVRPIHNDISGGTGFAILGNQSTSLAGSILGSSAFKATKALVGRSGTSLGSTDQSLAGGTRNGLKAYLAIALGIG
jgi:hypothetical protein